MDCEVYCCGILAKALLVANPASLAQREKTSPTWPRRGKRVCGAVQKNAGWLFSSFFQLPAAATGIFLPRFFHPKVSLVLRAHHPSNSDVHATVEAECVYLISAVMQLKPVEHLIVR